MKYSFNFKFLFDFENRPLKSLKITKRQQKSLKQELKKLDAQICTIR